MLDPKNIWWYPEDAVKNIKSPLEYKYVKYLRKMLTIVSLWPMEKKKSDYVYLVYLLFTKSTCLILIIGYLIKSWGETSFLDAGHMYITAFMNSMSLTRVILLAVNPKFRKLITRFIMEMHLFHHKNASDYAMKIHRRVHLFCHWYTVVLLIELLLGPTLFNGISLYSNYITGKLHEPYLYNTTYEQAVYYLYPTTSSTKRSTYMYVNIFNWYISFICCTVFLMIDLCVFLIVFHVWGHFKILMKKLNTFPRPAAESQVNKPYDGIMFSPTELKEVSYTLKQCINSHRFISSCTNDMSDTFGPMLLAYYIFQQVSCCLLLLECSQLTVEAFIRYGPLTVVIYQQLMQMYIIFEMIGTASEELKHSVYSIPWECMDIGNRRTCLIFLMLSQKSVSVKAMGVTQMGVTTMVGIIKTSVTYFTFLRTVAD